MSYQAHRTHRGTDIQLVKQASGKDFRGIVCGRCTLTNFDPRIAKPCKPVPESSSPLPLPPAASPEGTP